MSHDIVQPRTYYLVFGVLIALTVTTVGIDMLADLGRWQTPVALAIAAVKALYVIMVFMHVWRSPPLIRVVALGSLLWLAILLGYTLTDYMSRSWILVTGKN